MASRRPWVTTVARLRHRIGIWWLPDLADELGILLAHNTNSTSGEAPQIRAYQEAWRRNHRARPHQRRELQRLPVEADEAHHPRGHRDVTRIEGKPPKGWLSGGSHDIRGRLTRCRKRAGVCLSDWPCDDQPIYAHARRAHLAVPYPVEPTDSPQIIHRHHTAREFCDMLVDQLRKWSSTRAPSAGSRLDPSARVRLSVPVALLRKALQHCFASLFIERLWTRPGEIADYCRTLAPGIIPGS